MLIPNLRSWRERRALTQEELAEKAELAVRSVAGYEAGLGARPSSARKLAKALDIDVSALMMEEDSGKEQAPTSQVQFHTDEERRKAHVVLINSWAIARKDLRDEIQEFLDGLPSLPDDPNDLRVRTAEIQRLIKRSYSIERAVNESGADRLMLPYVEALQSREYLPNDIHGAVTAYQGAKKALMRDLIPRAEKWERRAREILGGWTATETEPSRTRDEEAKKT